MKTISEFMLKEHEKIRKKLEELKNTNNKIHIFNDLKWTLEKHLFLEEKVLFVFYEKIQGEEVDDFFNLMQEHERIMSLLKNIQDTLNENPSDKINELINLLEEHSFFEDKKFYPKLDSELSEEQKQEIFEKSKDILT